MMPCPALCRFPNQYAPLEWSCYPDRFKSDMHKCDADRKIAIALAFKAWAMRSLTPEERGKLSL